jgi:superfamily II DNA/RNA helicase
MFEFAVPAEHHITTKRNPLALFPLTLAIVGDLAAQVARTNESEAALTANKQELRFSAFFFDAYLNGEPKSPSKPYLTLLAAAAYYLCDLPGSAAVLARRLDDVGADRENRGLDAALIWLLRGRFEEESTLDDPCYASLWSKAATRVRAYYQAGGDGNGVLEPVGQLRMKSYRVGSARELLLADLIFAVTKRRLEISSRACLPRYTGLELAAWEATLAKRTFIREFWPAQRLLGEQGVFQGRSAIVQMPTSAGKTKATEILIRSAFFSQRTKLAVVVAPFRALCHEIRDSLVIAFRGEGIRIDEVSDVPQNDFKLAHDAYETHVLILTPEKLLYLIRQTDDLAQRIGLLIYDEGHQFDTGIRGVTYELLLTSLKSVVPADCQVVLISAVITNAAAINDWLNGADGSIVTGTDLHPNQRSIAFASWLDTLGRLEFIAQPDSGTYTFFVPRVLESIRLARRRRERTDRFFPIRGDGQSIALYLGLKLVQQGAVAVFCGRKSTVTKLCETLAEAYRRELKLSKPVAIVADDAARAETKKLAALVRRHYGPDGAIPDCADMGIFTHHGSSPTGLRLAVEYAMKESLVRMVICTSTLAQGVNLPIRYLIVTGIYQGPKRISVRDFQNLIGRAGRSGMHTEGSVIFADPETFDQRTTRNGRWRWGQVAELLDPSRAEACVSSLLTLFDPLDNDDHTVSAPLNVRNFFRAYLASNDGPTKLLRDLETSLTGRGYSSDGLRAQLQQKGQIVAALESFMMAASGEGQAELDEAAATELVRGTLAYHLANETQREDLIALFEAISQHVRKQVPEPKKRKAYAKTLFGVRESLAIHAWTSENVAALMETDTDDELMRTLWPILQLSIKNSLFNRCTQPKALLPLAGQWIDEQSPATMLAALTQAGVRFGEGFRPRYADIDHVVELCENAFAFEGVLVLAAVAEALNLDGFKDTGLVERIGHLQKRIKYGVKSAAAITLHEIGFADRVVAGELVNTLGLITGNRARLRHEMRARADEVEQVLQQFPAYYLFVWQSVLRGGRKRF